MKRVGDWTLHGLQPTENFNEFFMMWNRRKHVDYEPSDPLFKNNSRQIERHLSFHTRVNPYVHIFIFHILFYYHTHILHILQLLHFFCLTTNIQFQNYNGGYAIIFISPIELDCSPTIVVHILINIVTS